MSARNKDITPKWKRNALNSAVVLALSGLCAAPAFSDAMNTSVYGIATVISGSISASATNSGGTSGAASAYGVYNGGLIGTLTNGGTISTSASTSSTTAYTSSYNAAAYGVSADLSGTLTNSGTISATVIAIYDSGPSYAIDYGIYADSIDAMNNTETISAAASASGSNAYGNAYASAYGVYAGGTVWGSGTGLFVSRGGISSLSNSGTISAIAINFGNANNYGVTSVVAAAYANAYGVRSGGGISMLSNAGTISASATNSGDAGASAVHASAYALAYGVYSAGWFSTLTNEGTISASATNSGYGVYGWTVATANAYARAYGVYGGGGISTLSNAYGGVISASAANSDDAIAYYATNSYAHAYAYARAYGVYAGGDISTLSNNGTISANASNSGNAYANALVDVDATAFAAAFGIYAGGGISTLSNDGNISASAINFGNANAYTAASADVYAAAYGVYAGAGISTMSNSGTISANAMNSGNIIAYDAVSNLADHAYATAYGIYMGGDTSNSGIIYANATNSGQVDAYFAGDDIVAYAYASAYGVDADSVLLAGRISQGVSTLNNNGTISANAANSGSVDAHVAGNDVKASANARAYGVYAGDGASFAVGWGGISTLSNDGEIGAFAINSGNAASYVGFDVDATAYANAYGIYKDGSIAVLNNTSTISADANNLGNADAHDAGNNAVAAAYATAYGIYVAPWNNGSASASIRNVGAHQDCPWCESYGNIAALSNSGTISASATNYGHANASAALVFFTATAYAGAYGIYAGRDIGALSNTGTVIATAFNSGNGDLGGNTSAKATGIYAANNLTGSLVNDDSGTISVTSTNSGNAAAFNAGYVFATAYAKAYGVDVGDSIASLSNNGTISVGAFNAGNAHAHNATTALADAYASAYGVYARGITSLSNNGSILVISINTGIAEAYDAATTYAAAVANAYGVYTYGLSGTISNANSISASATNSANAYYGGHVLANAYGVNVSGTLNGALNNASSGSVSAAAVAANGTANAYGVYVGALDGTLNNAGAISATATGSIAHAYSIWADGGVGSITNQPGGLLSGNIYTGGSVAVSNAGTISIPATAYGATADNGIGDNSKRGYIAGNYTQSATGDLQFGAINATNYGQLRIDGAGDLSASNTITILVPVVNTLHANDVLDNVVSAGSWIGLASGTSVNARTINVIGSPLYFFTGTEDTHGNIDITVNSVSSFSGLYSSLGSLGGMLDGLVAKYGTGNSAMDAMLDKLYGLGATAELNDAIKQLRPGMSAGGAQVTADTLGGTNNVILARLDERRGMASGDDFVTNRNGWVKPLGAWADQDDKGLVTGYSTNTYGIVMGADGQRSQDSRLGAALALTNTKVDSNDSHQRSRINGYQAVLYGSHALDARTDLDWQADYGHNTNTGTRYMPAFSATAASDSTSSSMHAGARVGRAFPMNAATTIIPTAHADYTRISENAYTETGAGALNLSVAGKDTSAFVLGVGGKVGHAMSDTTKLIADLGVDYDTQAEQASINASFVGGGPVFTSTGINPAKTSVRGGLGVVVNSSKTMEITARYDLVSRSGYMQQTASVKFNMPF